MKWSLTPALKEFRLVWDMRAGGTRFQSRVVLTKKENLRQSLLTLGYCSIGGVGYGLVVCSRSGSLVSE